MFISNFQPKMSINLCKHLKNLVAFILENREGNGTPVQYSCLENPMGGGAWWAAVHGVAKSRAWLSNFPFSFHFHALEKEMATHSSVLAWRIPGTEEPGGLPSVGSHRVRHDWRDLAAAAVVIWSCQWLCEADTNIIFGFFSWGKWRTEGISECHGARVWLSLKWNQITGISILHS